MPEALRTTEQLAGMNHYERLGLASDASVEEIKKAYRRLSLHYHPDKRPPEECNGGFALINDAHAVLSDPEARRDYDVTLRTGYQSNAWSANQMPFAGSYAFIKTFIVVCANFLIIVACLPILVASNLFAGMGVNPTARERERAAERERTAERARSARMREAASERYRPTMSEYFETFERESFEAFERESATESARNDRAAEREAESTRARLFATTDNSTSGILLQDYCNQWRILEQKIEELANYPSMRDVLSKAKQVANELRKRVHPIGKYGHSIGYDKNDPRDVLILLAEVCSRVTHGLHFIATSGHPFSCELFEKCETGGVRLHKTTYDATFHKESMLTIDRIAKQLPGYRGWKGLRNALFALAGALLVAAVVVGATCSTGGIGLAVALSSVALLTAGGGFFAGRDTGLFKTVHDANTSLKASIPLSP